MRLLFDGQVAVETDPRNKFLWFKSSKATHVFLLDNSVPAGREHNGHVLDFLRSVLLHFEYLFCRMRLKTSTDEFLKSEKPIGVLSQITNSFNSNLERYVQSKKGKLPLLLIKKVDNRLCIIPNERVERKDLTFVPFTTHLGRTGLHIELNSSTVAPVEFSVNSTDCM